MVDLVASNLKLKQRSRNILRGISRKCNSLSDPELDALITKCNSSVKLAILVAETGEPVEACKTHLESAGGVLATALDGAQPTQSLSPSHELSRRFVLCIDGGGTKCAVVVADPTGLVSHGYAGPCNLYVFIPLDDEAS